MTTADETDPTIQIAPKRQVDWDQDGALVGVVQTANRMGPGYTVSITLVVAGQTISGQLISGEEFWNLAAERGGPVHPDDARENAEHYAGMDDDEIPAMFHLRNAHYLVGLRTLPDLSQEGVLFRGRLDRVAGWSAGALGLPPEAD